MCWCWRRKRGRTGGGAEHREIREAVEEAQAAIEKGNKQGVVTKVLNAIGHVANVAAFAEVAVQLWKLLGL